jgi:hypothetical protein
MSFHVRMCCGFSHNGVAYNSGDVVPDDVARIYPERCVRIGDTAARVMDSYEVRSEPEPQPVEEVEAEEEVAQEEE